MGQHIQGKLEGKTAIITGAAAGLGEGIAEVYAKYGANICMVDLSPDVEHTAARIRGLHPDARIITITANVADKAQMIDAAKRTADTFGTIDIACCNAGVCRLAPFEDMTDEMRDFHIDVNIKGVWNSCQAVIPYMLANGGGSIVIASSVTGDIVADAGEAAYAMTKAALVGLTKCLAVEYADRHIRVNCSQLGYARTPMVEKMAIESNPADPESAIRDIAAGVPMKRLAKPTEVGELFAFLGSDESSYITGAQMVIDGGSTLPETMSIGTN
ncbi:SDR family oxidoreductase UcpA [Bifidobacterium sp. 82T10]|uniref:SDR family oxidoreductase UcpA n=1 Tax=Bifidobacterium miconis TaxID=2834435 RepID=A0ABS6WHJ8_9BIFI|nr:SDR family oxidoreductase UcpA [Bifidobacterium miconis]MBW3093523.1 SDR family oxidoreductase UcpA [Bifidobacterium miconis]